MNKTILASMREQMCPSEAAQAALWARLEAEPMPEKKEMRFVKSWKSLALAACAALVLCAYPAYNALRPAPVLHSVTTIDASAPAAMKTDFQEGMAMGVDKGEEEGPNTGDLPGGAYIGEVPTQPGADAYQLLMDHFGGTLPDWYGGAYITPNGTLMIFLVDSQDPGDKSLELKVLDVVGRTAPVGFTSAKYSRNELERMNGELLDLMDGRGIPASWGIYDDQNRIVLDVSEPLPDDLLAAIAKIDPNDDAIHIRVVEGQTTVTQDLMKDPAPIGESADPAPGGETKPQEKLPAVVQDLPGEKETPAEYDLLPLE